ncbi:MAG: hypothetical protein HZB37_08110 [Planctomycetes bacterium]|nr:hypothetical protein [Planctomycetota bacterium]
MINRVRLGIMVLLAVFALVYVSEVRAENIEKGAKVAGTWVAQGQWVGDGSWSETWTITQKKKKITGHSSAGYDFKGKVKGTKITFQISAGCHPNYEGTVSNNNSTMGGTMQCTSGTGNGTWSATETTDAPESSGASAASPGE